MPIAPFSAPIVGADIQAEPAALFGRRDVTLAGMVALLGACTPAPTRTASAPPPPPPSPPLPFDQAVLNAANAVLSSAPAQAQNSRQLVVIDPLVDGVTGEQSTATQTIQTRIAELARDKYPRFDIEPFSPQAVSRLPYVMLGTFTPANAANQPNGDRDAFRFCLIMADLRSGKVLARAWARARQDGVDTTPIAFFRDSPAWTDDPQTKAYIDTCQSVKIGDPINPVFLDGILAASIISDATAAYAAGRYGDAIDLYTNARSTKAGNQLRIYNGLYLANWRLGRSEPAAAAFGDAVDYGLANNRLGVKILFKPGSTAPDPGTPAQPYDMWIEQIANRTAQRNACLTVVGNTSKSGSPALNERLSLLRADFIKGRLESTAPALNGHINAQGLGAEANLIGTGADNASDALDRRVEFKVSAAC